MKVRDVQRQGRWALPIALIMASSALLSAGPISFDTFGPVVNSNADGSFFAPSSQYPLDTSSFDLIGGNNGTGFAGETDLLTVAAVSGTVQFSWSYTSCDPFPACDWPGYDWAGFMVGINQDQLTDTDTGGVTSVTQFTVAAGDTYGWYVGTFDNNGGPGILTVSSAIFTPDSNTPNPEPGTLLTGCAGLLACVAAMRRQRGRGKGTTR